MKKLPSFLFLLFAALLLGPPAASAQTPPQGYRYIRYAQFLEDTNVTLTDGSEWAMDKGDCFPIDMFKDQQTKVILKLGDATFMTESKRVRVLDEKENDNAVKSYRITLNAYLKNRGDAWKRENAGGSPKKP